MFNDNAVQSPHNTEDAIVPEMDIVLKGYYSLLDQCADYPEWTRKIEEDLGPQVRYLMNEFDESVRDAVVAYSDTFARFEMEKQKYFK